SELQFTQFTDLVASDNNMHYTALGAFSFYVERARDFGERLQACMDAAYGADVWTVDYGSIEQSKDFEMSIANNTSCWDALAQWSNESDVNFIVRGRTITLGWQQTVLGHPFVYGRGNGLKSLTQVINADQRIITRLKAYGSERNIPYRYYNLKRSTCYGKVLSVANSIYIILDVIWSDSIHTGSGTPGHQGQYNVTIKYNNTTYSASILSYPYNEINRVAVVKPSGMATPNIGNKIYVTVGVNKRVWAQMEGDGSKLESMYVPRLMLPGFPNESLHAWVTRTAQAQTDLGARVQALLTAGFTFSTDQYLHYIFSPTLNKYGQRDGEVIFDGSDEDWDEIYPTMTEMTVSDLSSIPNYSGSVTYQNNGNAFQVLNNSSVQDNGVSADGRYEDGSKDTDGKEIKTTFTLRIPNVGFNPWQYVVSGEVPTLSIQSGMCQSDHGEFEILSCKPLNSSGTEVTESIITEDGKLLPIGCKQYELTLERVYDENINMYYPNSTFQVSAGDKFVLTGIEMPDAYIESAAVRLLFQSCEWLSEEDHEKPTYQPEIDNIFMANNPDVSDGITEGMKMTFSDVELGIAEASVTISQLVIKEGQGGENAVSIPQYEVSLSDDVEATLMQQVDTRIHLANADYSQSFANIQRQLAFRLSRINDDDAQGLITFLQGLRLGGGIYGIDANGQSTLSTLLLNSLQGSQYTGGDLVGDKGFKLWEDESGYGHLDIDFLTARIKAYFAQLEIRKVTFTQGNVFFSSAGSRLMWVMPVDADGNVITPTYEVVRWFSSNGMFFSANGGWYAVNTTEEYTTEEMLAMTKAWRCYEMADDGTTATTNSWEPGDMARCQTFNIDSGVYQGVSNRYYGRLVIRKGREELEDGRLYNYVDLSDESSVYIDVGTEEEPDSVLCSGMDNRTGVINDIPVVGDHIVQVGSQTDTDRQALIELRLSDGGSINLYSGVDDWDLADHCVISEGKNGFIVNADYFKLTTTQGQETLNDVLKGARIITDSASVVVNAGSDSRISAISQVTSLPTYIQVKDGDTIIPPSNWTICKVNGKVLINRTGQIMPDVLTQLTPSKTDAATLISLSWSYTPVVILNNTSAMSSGKLPMYVQYTKDTLTKEVELEIPVIVNTRGIDGSGQPVVVTLSPSNIIIDEVLTIDSQTGEYSTSLDTTYAYADVLITDGSTTTTPDSVTVNAENTGFTASVQNTNRVVIGNNVSSGVRQGVILVYATYGSAQYELMLGVYVNRLGSWELQAIGDIMTSIATRTITVYDENDQPITTTSISQIYQDATQVSVSASAITFKTPDGTTVMQMAADTDGKYKVIGTYFKMENLEAKDINITGQSIFRGFLMREKYIVQPSDLVRVTDSITGDHHYEFPDFTQLGSWVIIPDGIKDPDNNDLLGLYDLILPHFPLTSNDSGFFYMNGESYNIEDSDADARWAEYLEYTMQFVGAKLMIDNQTSGVVTLRINTLLQEYGQQTQQTISQGGASVQKWFPDLSIYTDITSMCSLECKMASVKTAAYTGIAVFWEVSMQGLPDKDDEAL
ncbi:MAG: hypothetical protein J5510_05440, partial [Prevotella sp.]|nr:hypothetical protein [Prevotella sp.]